MKRNRRKAVVHPSPVTATPEPGELIDFQNFPVDALAAARSLLSCSLCHRDREGRILRLPITETEAYDGPADKACHASKGRTPRTDILFGPPGYWYVYLCYGVHWMLNLVVGPKDYPAAILIRSAGVYIGPGRLTRGMEIDGTLNKAAVTQDCGLWLERNSAMQTVDVLTTPRIGVDYAGPDWAGRHYRFLIQS